MDLFGFTAANPPAAARHGGGLLVRLIKGSWTDNE